MNGNKTVVDRLRKLAGREMRMLTRADALLCELAAATIDQQQADIQAAREREDKAIRDACNSGALVSVARGQLAALIDLLERHACRRPE